MPGLEPQFQRQIAAETADFCQIGSLSVSLIRLVFKTASQEKWHHESLGSLFL